jgi:omega-6 fatty acid desaturase (delta-12 desaturase)
MNCDNHVLGQRFGDTEHKRTIYKHVAKFAKADDMKATLILLQTLVIKAILLYFNNWKLLPLYILFKFKTFIIFHDLAHLSWFTSEKWNKVVGILVGATVTMPRVNWADVHDYHHHHTNLEDDSAAMFKQTVRTSSPN